MTNTATNTTNNTTNILNKFSQDTLDRMSYLIQYDLSLYLDLYFTFVSNNQQDIINFYQSSQQAPDYQSFSFLQNLVQQSQIVDNLIRVNRNNFSSVDQWEVLDMLDTISIKLATIINASKWLRSTKSLNSWQGKAIQTTYTLQDNQTIEDIAALQTNGVEAQDTWMNLAISNDLREWDYGQGKNPKINVIKQQSSSPDYFLNSIVDNLINEALYGLDFDDTIHFVNNDLAILNYVDTVKQSVHNLVSLLQGDIPEFPNMGVDPLLIGGNMSMMDYSTIVRQLQNTFATDDSLRNFQILKFSYQNGQIFISFNVDTFYHLTYGGTQGINPSN